MPKFDALQNLMAAAEAHTFTEAEIRLLALMATKEATDAIGRYEYSAAIAAMGDALGHLRALRDKKAFKEVGK